MMEFEEEHEEEEEEEEEEEDEDMAITPTFKAAAAGSGPPSSTTTNDKKPGPIAAYRYRECLKNHAVGMGGHAVDGCGEFMPAGPEGTLDALKCAACNCHRNFHRKELLLDSSASSPNQLALYTPRPQYPHPQQHQVYQFYPYNRGSAASPSYLQVSSCGQQQQQARPLALPSPTIAGTQGGVGGVEQQEDVMMGGMSSLSRKRRFRTKFSQEQKDKMLQLAEQLGWRIQKQDEPLVQDFCNETGVKRHILKVWMHNNKHTLDTTPEVVPKLEKESQENACRNSSYGHL